MRIRFFSSLSLSLNNNLIYLGFEDVDPSSILVVLVGIDEHHALEG